MPRPVLARPARLVPAADHPADVPPGKLVLRLADVITAWPWPRRRPHRSRTPAKIGVNLSLELARRLRAHCETTGITVSAFAAAAIAARLELTSEGEVTNGG